MSELPQPGSAVGPWPPRRVLRALLAAALVALSGYYIVQVLADGYAGVAAASMRLSGLESGSLVLGILGTLVLSVVYHVLAVRRIEAHQVPATAVALAYALGQVMRYIPGRVFGLVFQVKYLAGRIRAATIAMALLVQTVYDYAWAAVFLGSMLLAYRLGQPWPVALLVPAIGLVWWLHRHAWAERALASPWLLRRFLGEGQVEWLRRPPSSLAASLALGLVWVPMLLGIAMALAAHVGFSPALALGALYLVSAVLSLLVVVVPSGLFVREALFAWLGSRYGFPPDTLVFLGLLLRVAMTASEVLLVGVCLAADSARSYRHRGLHRGQ